MDASFFLPEPCGYDTASVFCEGVGFVTVTGFVGLVGWVSESPFCDEVEPEAESLEGWEPFEEESEEVEPVEEEGVEAAGLVPHFPS